MVSGQSVPREALTVAERYSGGTLSGLNVTNTFDSYLRRSTVGFRNGTTTLGSSTYGYDTASRLVPLLRFGGHPRRACELGSRHT